MGEDEVTLWHGTTASAAKAIVSDGLRAVDAGEIVAQTAEEQGVDAGELIDVLNRLGRYVVRQSDRRRSAWFAVSPRKDARWAQRAPAARWEALWAVWIVRHGAAHDDDPPWNDTAAAGWHAGQLLPEQPAIVEVQVPVSCLKDRYQQRLVGERLEGFRRLASIERWPEVSVAHPVPAEWVVGYEVVERTITFREAAGLLGATVEDLTERVESGVVTRPHPPDEPVDPWYWSIEELEPFLLGTTADDVRSGERSPSSPGGTTG